MNISREKMLATLNEAEEKLRAYSLPLWEELPDIALYMDQVISILGKYMAIYYETIGDEKSITASMINNYVKLGFMPAPVKKKYSKIHMAYLLVNHLGIKRYVVNVKDAVDAVINNLPDEIGITAQTRPNIPPRVRMTTLYAVSQSCNGRVCNTCNLSEDWVGYSTRYGDSVGDFSPMSNLTVTEVKQIGHLLGLPAELVEKVPIDGLCGKTDEENLGFTYAMLDRYIRTGEI